MNMLRYFKNKLKIIHHFSLLAIVALGSVAWLALLDFYYKSEINAIISEQGRLLSVKNQLAEIEREILYARLDESQMINIRKADFFKNFEQRINRVREITHRKKLMSDTEISDIIEKPQKKMLVILDQYHQSVYKILILHQDMGLDGKTGILLDLGQLEHHLREAIYTIENNKLRAIFTKMQPIEKNFSSTLNVKLVDRLLKLADTLNYLIKNENLSLEQQKKLLSYIDKYREKVLQLLDRIIELEDSIENSGRQFQNIFPTLRMSQDETNKFIDLTAEKMKRQVDKSEFQTRITFSIVFIILLVILIVQIRGARSLMVRLEELTGCMQDVASGNFQKAAELARKHDEIGVLASTFKRMASRIKSQLMTIEKEREKSEKLLLNTLPPSIAHRLKREEEIADKFDDVTVLFCDIVNFTAFAAHASPEEVIHVLNMIFTSFDNLTVNPCLEKIKTIGDAYMVVGGVPNPCDNHTELLAQVALEMIDIVAEISERLKKPLSVRIGIHSGPVIAGVIGTTKYTYDLWGDTVNIASRMESLSENGKIQCSETVYHLLKDKFDFAFRGQIAVKGRGNIRTYFLNNAHRKI